MKNEENNTAPHTESEETPIDRTALWGGVLLWLIVACIAVWLRGVRWDEAYERAQIITGLVQYPTDHPLYRFSISAVTVFHLLPPFILRFFPGPLVVSTIQAVLHLCAAIIPVYLLAAVVGRRALAGHVAAVCVLLGVHLGFVSYYPLSIWPDRFTIAHIALGYALLTILALATGRRRLGALMVGLIPIIHIGQTPIIALLALMIGLRMLYQKEYKKLRTVLAFGIIGLAISGVGFATIATGTLPPLTPDSPFFSTADPHDAWARYTTQTDVHRAYPRFGVVSLTNIVLLGMIWLGGIATWTQWRHTRRFAVHGWLWAYSLALALVFWSILALQATLGTNTPFLLVGWMPHRLPNHVIVILLALLIGLIAKQDRTATQKHNNLAWLLVAALALAVIKPLFQLLLPETLYARYVAPPEMLYFFLAGGALAALGMRTDNSPKFKSIFLLGTLIALTTLGIYHHTGCAYLLVGLSVALLLPRLTLKYPWTQCARTGTIATMLLCTLCTIGTLHNQWQSRAHLPITDWDKAVIAYLDQAGEPNAMLLTPGWDIDQQMRTGHPILATYETQAIASYMPSLAAGIEKLYTDIYGYKFGEPWHYPLETWQAHTSTQWKALAQKYGFNYIISPKNAPLNLNPVLQDNAWSLYHIPKN